MGVLRMKLLLMLMIFLHPVFIIAQSSSDSSLMVLDTTVVSFDTVIHSPDSLSRLHLDSIGNVSSDSLSHILNDSIAIVSSDSLPLVNDSVVLDYLFRKDSLDVYSFSFFNDSINYRVLKYIDTSNHSSGQYNPVKYFNVAYNDLGVAGSAQDNQIFIPATQSGFSIGFNNYNAYFQQPQDIQLFDTRSPYTKLLYVMGPVKEHTLRIIHAQSFLDNQLTANFDFRLFHNLGVYIQQGTDVKSFNGGMGYRTKDSRYKVQAQYYHNKQVLEENGGITDLAVFENNQENNRQIITTNLKTGENFIRKSGIAIQQSFNISKAEPDLSKIPDTNIIEFEGYSVTHFKKPYFDPVSHLGQIKYYFNYERNNFKYTDQEQKSKIYDSIPFYPTYDSTSFFDSIGMKKYQNEIIYTNSDYKDNASSPKFLNYFFGARHEYNEYEQDSVKQYFTHYALIGGVFVNISSYLSVLSDVEYYIGDYLNNDISFNAKAFLKLWGNQLTGGLKISHRSPDWIYQNFSSSRFTWKNDFEKTNVQQMFLKFQRKNLDVLLQVQNINQLVFFNDQILPEQNSDNIQHILVQAQKDIRLGPWGTDLRVSYQSVSHPDVIRVPEITGKMKLFYHNILFNDALGLEIGVELSYFTAYYANKYMPTIRSFHIQNEQLIGDYPYMDVYVNAKIGKARLFVRYDHFNAGMMGYTYYASPNYPAQDASFRFGVTWILFN